MSEDPFRIGTERLRYAKRLHQVFRRLEMPVLRLTVLQQQFNSRPIARAFAFFANADVLAGIGRRILIDNVADLMGQDKRHCLAANWGCTGSAADQAGRLKHSWTAIRHVSKR